ncbi:MAG TPA: cellulase family glycosylhydrolase [Polyangiaceae bacterium]|nr:cellulase family glycosylhydrolase [Polyangiaceae bacterium]
MGTRHRPFALRFDVLAAAAVVAGAGCGSDHAAGQAPSGDASSDAGVIAEDAPGGGGAPLDGSTGGTESGAGPEADAARDAGANPDTGGGSGGVDGGALGGLHVEGAKLVDNGKTVRLLGVNISGTETYCEQGIGIFQAPTMGGGVDPAVVSAMKSWNVNAVRVPLNEDCWLGINGVKAQYGGQNYAGAISGFVQQLRGAGMYVILDLHWNAPGSSLATGQQPMADADHSPAFWAAVAAAFKGDLGVVFDLYNEPNVDGGNVTAASWQCWRDGCSVSNWSGFMGSAKTAGMQQLVSAVRGAGAGNVIMLGGLGDAEFVDPNWLTYEPTDTLTPANLAASHHNYSFNGGCNKQGCWTTNLAAVLAKVPIITGELGENDCAHGYVDSYFAWADPLGISYLGWTWNNWDCGSGPSLVKDFYGTPTSTYGEGFKAHLLTQ